MLIFRRASAIFWQLNSWLVFLSYYINIQGKAKKYCHLELPNLQMNILCEIYEYEMKECDSERLIWLYSHKTMDDDIK